MKELINNKNIVAYASYFSIATILHILLTYEWIIAGEIYAETANSYYLTAISNNTFLEQLLTNNCGNQIGNNCQYVTPILRIPPYLAKFFNLDKVFFIYIFSITIFATIVIAPSIFISNKFEVIHTSINIRAACSLAISSIFNFESRIYVNISYMFIIIIFIIILNYFRGGNLSIKDKFIIIILSLSKPYMIIISPLIISILIWKKKKIFFILFFLLILFNIYLIDTVKLPLLRLIDLMPNIIILCFYNIGKIILLFIPSILIKKNIFGLEEYILNITALIGFIAFFALYLNIKENRDRKLFLIILIMNIICSTLIVLGHENTLNLYKKLNSDFNRYDIVTIINIISLLAISNNYFKFYNIKIATLIILMSTIVTYSCASLYQFNHLIRNNILYIGTSTWKFTADDKNYYDCALLSPLGWGYKCSVHTNLIGNSSYIPKLKEYNREILIEVPTIIKNGYMVLFSDNSNHNKFIVMYNDNNYELKGNIIPLIFNRYAFMYKVNCDFIMNDRCTLKVKFENAYLYTSNNSDKSPLIVFIYKN